MFLLGVEAVFAFIVLTLDQMLQAARVLSNRHDGALLVEVARPDLFRVLALYALHLFVGVCEVPVGQRAHAVV